MTARFQQNLTSTRQLLDKLALIGRTTVVPFYNPESCTHVRRTHLRAMDRAVLHQPSTSGKPFVSHLRNPADTGVAGPFGAQHFHQRPVALGGRTVRGWMDPAVRRPRLRAQSAGVLTRLAISICRRALVVGQDQRSGLSQLVWFVIILFIPSERSDEGALPGAKWTAVSAVMFTTFSAA